MTNSAFNVREEINIFSFKFFWWFYFDLHTGFFWKRTAGQLLFQSSNFHSMFEQTRIASIGEHQTMLSHSQDNGYLHIPLENNASMQSWISSRFFLKKAGNHNKMSEHAKDCHARWIFYGNLHLAECRLWLRYSMISRSIYLSTVISSYVNANMILCFHKCPLGMI